MKQVVIQVSPVKAGIVVTEEILELDWPGVNLSDEMSVSLQTMDHPLNGGQVLSVVCLLQVNETTLSVL